MRERANGTLAIISKLLVLGHVKEINGIPNQQSEWL